MIRTMTMIRMMMIVAKMTMLLMMRRRMVIVDIIGNIEAVKKLTKC